MRLLILCLLTLLAPGSFAKDPIVTFENPDNSKILGIKEMVHSLARATDLEASNRVKRAFLHTTSMHLIVLEGWRWYQVHGQNHHGQNIVFLALAGHLSEMVVGAGLYHVAYFIADFSPILAYGAKAVGLLIMIPIIGDIVEPALLLKYAIDSKFRDRVERIRNYLMGPPKTWASREKDGTIELSYSDNEGRLLSTFYLARKGSALGLEKMEFFVVDRKAFSSPEWKRFISQFNWNVRRAIQTTLTGLYSEDFANLVERSFIKTLEYNTETRFASVVTRPEALRSKILGHRLTCDSLLAYFR